VVSVNVGPLREVLWHGKAITAGIWKEPVSGRVELWSRERPELDFDAGRFGGNLTTEGLLDTDVGVGDRFRIGTAELVVTQPRLPCFKLGAENGA
jgi:MOSC domain-containing protein YiiM